MAVKRAANVTSRHLARLYRRVDFVLPTPIGSTAVASPCGLGDVVISTAALASKPRPVILLAFKDRV